MPRFRPLPLGAVRPRGWLLAQLRCDLEHGFAARLDQLTPRAAHDLFRQRIGSSDDYFAWWDAETRGNWLWGFVQMAVLADLEEPRRRAAELVGELLATQDADGYIGIYAADAGRYRHAPGENGELWAQSRALLPLIAWHEATGDARLLEAVRRAVALTLAHYGPDRPYFALAERRSNRDYITGLTHGLCFLDVLEWLHGRTGDEAFAQAGVRLYLEFSALPRPFPNDDLALPSLADPRLPFGGHAVHTAEHLRALLWTSELAPDRVPPSAVESALARLGRYRLPSGALLGDENVHGLPMPEAPYEYCTTTELAWSLSSGVQKLGRAELGDWLETVVFNAGQGARLPDGSAISYLTTDTRLSATAERPDAHGPPGRRFKYSPTHDDVACCCNPNAVRLLPQYVSRMWLRLAGEEGLAAVAYGPCELAGEVGGARVRIEERTGYPFSDELEFAVQVDDGPVEFALLLRRPAWAGSMDVRVEGAEPSWQDGWCRIRKLWSGTESVRIRFSWPVRAERYANGEVAVLRGPLQYALPLEHRLHAIRDYPAPAAANERELHDYEALPVDIAQGYRIPVLDGAAPDLGLTLETRPDASPDRPWDASPLALRAGDQVLVPIGSAVLRRSAFPLR